MGKRKKQMIAFELLLWNFSGKQITDQRKGPYWHILLFFFFNHINLIFVSTPKYQSYSWFLKSSYFEIILDSQNVAESLGKVPCLHHSTSSD